MWLSYLILAGTDLLLLLTTLVLGLIVGSRAAGALPVETRLGTHEAVAIIALLFTVFVQVLGFTYFVVQARMAQEAAGALPRESALCVQRFKSRALRWLALGVGAALTAGIFGVLVDDRPLFDPLWHMASGILALAVNAAAFGVQLGLIRRNAALFDQLNHDGPA